MALLQLQKVLAPSGVFYATFFALEPGRSWLRPHPRNKWGRDFEILSPSGPLPLPTYALLKDLARQAGVSSGSDQRFWTPHPDHGPIPSAHEAALVLLICGSDYLPHSGMKLRPCHAFSVCLNLRLIPEWRDCSVVFTRMIPVTILLNVWLPG